MATARELLAQVDALMRRNRGDTPRPVPPLASVNDPDDGAIPGIPPDIPTLDEALATDDEALAADDEALAADDDAPLSPTVILPERAEVEWTVPDDRTEIAWIVPEERNDIEWIETLPDLPILTDAVEVGDDASARVAPPALAAPPDRADWSELAEEIRSQVLQRLDLFTDTGLREQLGAHLQPIVDRASAELVDAINRKVGELVRSYVAEAIEREIDAWRHRDA